MNFSQLILLIVRKEVCKPAALKDAADYAGMLNQAVASSDGRNGIQERGKTVNKENRRQALQTLITYFESGTSESDAVAKAILATDRDYWRQETERFQKSTEWTGIRAPEAELLALALRDVNILLEEGS